MVSGQSALRWRSGAIEIFLVAFNGFRRCMSSANPIRSSPGTWNQINQSTVKNRVLKKPSVRRDNP